MDITVFGPQYAAALFAAMLVCLEIGRRLGVRRRAKLGDSSGFGTAEGAIFALFGLLIAFTFSGALERFNSRRMLIADEANAVGTAYLRVDLLASADQPDVRRMFREYLDARIGVYRALPDLQKAVAELQRAADMQAPLWTRAIAASRAAEAHPNAAMLMLPALNQMFDITTTRTMAARTHPPDVIYQLLFLLGLGCAILAGHAMAGDRTWSWLHAVGFAAFVALAAYVITEIEFPRAGLIRVSAFDDILVQLRESMK
jgi:hypothetical protein